jgi:hypothetical protein
MWADHVMATVEGRALNVVPLRNRIHQTLFMILTFAALCRPYPESHVLRTLGRGHVTGPYRPLPPFAR